MQRAITTTITEMKMDSLVEKLGSFTIDERYPHPGISWFFRTSEPTSAAEKLNMLPIKRGMSVITKYNTPIEIQLNEMHTAELSPIEATNLKR